MNLTIPYQRRLRGEGFRVINSSIEPFNGDMPETYTTINIQSDGSLIIGVSNEQEEDISSTSDLTWGFPWSNVAIESKISIQGKQAIKVSKNIYGDIQIGTGDNDSIRSVVGSISVFGDVGGPDTIQAISITGSIKCPEVDIESGGGVCVQLGPIEASSIGVNMSDITAGLGAFYAKNIQCTDQGNGSYFESINSSAYGRCVGILGSLSVDNTNTSNSLTNRYGLAIDGIVQCNDPQMSCIRLENGINGSYSEGLYIGSQNDTTDAITGFMNVGINILGNITGWYNTANKSYINNSIGVNITGNIISYNNIMITGNLSSENQGILIDGNITSVQNAIQVGQQQQNSTKPILYQLNATSGCGFVLFGDTYSSEGIRIAMSGDQSNEITVVVGGKVVGNIDINGDVNGNINITGNVGNILEQNKFGDITIIGDVSGTISANTIGGLSASCVNTITLSDETCSTKFLNGQTSITGIKSSYIDVISVSKPYDGSIPVAEQEAGYIGSISTTGCDIGFINVQSIDYAVDGQSYKLGGNIGNRSVTNAINVDGNINATNYGIKIGGSIDTTAGSMSRSIYVGNEIVGGWYGIDAKYIKSISGTAIRVNESIDGFYYGIYVKTVTKNNNNIDESQYPIYISNELNPTKIYINNFNQSYIIVDKLNISYSLCPGANLDQQYS